MEEDDDMILIIVGDKNEENTTFPMPTSISIKEETAYELEECAYSKLDPKSILESAELHGEYISLQDENFDCEYLEVVNNDKIQKRELKIKQTAKKETRQESQSGSDDDDNDDDVDGNPKFLSNPKLSYIARLRKNFPRMRKDEDYLVEHLTEIMKNTKPPIPPIDFCNNVNGRLVCAYCELESLTLPIACRHYQKKHGSRYLSCYACGTGFRCTTGLYKHEKRCVAPGARLVLKARGRYLGRKGRRRPYLTLNKFKPWDNKAQAKKKSLYKQEKKSIGPCSEGSDEKYLLYCSQCPASFKHKDALSSHEYMHRGVRPYQCDQCPAAYTSNIGLKRHLVRHTDLQHICDVCGRVCKAKNTLIVHMNTHLPQRKFPCDRCERRFAQKSALQHHVRRDHLNIPPPFGCAVCPKRFPRMSNLKLHMMTKHGLTLMTRQMFFKALPTMKETELQHATVVFNNFDNKVIAAPFGEATLPMFISQVKTTDTDISTKSEDSDMQTVEMYQQPSKPSDRQVVTEILPLNTVEQTIEVRDSEINEYVKNRHEEILGTTNNKGHMLSEEVLGTPKKAVIQKSLQEGCELEFVKFISQIGECSNTLKKRSGTKIPRIDLSILQMHKNIQKHTARGRDMPVLISDDKKEVTDNTNEIHKVTKANKSAPEVRLDDKKVKEGQTKTKNNAVKREPVQTRSGAMKTRSGAVMKSDVKGKRNSYARKNR